MTCRRNDDLAQIIINHTQDYLDNSNVKRDEFIKNGLVPQMLDAGHITEPDNADDFLRWQKSQCKRVERIMKCEVVFPADIAFVWISALAEPFKSKCLNDVCGALGTFYTPLPTLGHSPELTEVSSKISNLSREFADVLQHAAPAMDGVYNSQDSRAELQQLSNEVFELITAGIVELGAIKQASGILPSAYQSLLNSQLFK